MFLWGSISSSLLIYKTAFGTLYHNLETNINNVITKRALLGAWDLDQMTSIGAFQPHLFYSISEHRI